jgi:chromosomal replication initiation ATPase DnaA
MNDLLVEEPLAVGLRGYKAREAVIPILKKYCISWAEAIKSKRHAHIVTVRYEIFYALRGTGMSLPQIGDLCGRHHTTILHGIKRQEERLAAQRLRNSR